MLRRPEQILDSILKKGRVLEVAEQKQVASNGK
jgi:hypothetical protein